MLETRYGLSKLIILTVLRLVLGSQFLSLWYTLLRSALDGWTYVVEDVYIHVSHETRYPK